MYCIYYTLNENRIVCKYVIPWIESLLYSNSLGDYRFLTISANNIYLHIPGRKQNIILK